MTSSFLRSCSSPLMRPVGRSSSSSPSCSWNSARVRSSALASSTVRSDTFHFFLVEGRHKEAVGSATSRGKVGAQIGGQSEGTSFGDKGPEAHFDRCVILSTLLPQRQSESPFRAAAHLITGVNSLSPRVLLAVITIMANTRMSLSRVSSHPKFN